MKPREYSPEFATGSERSWCRRMRTQKMSVFEARRDANIAHAEHPGSSGGKKARSEAAISYIARYWAIRSHQHCELRET